MPKELINDCSGADIHLRVGWERDSYVQVASVKDNPFTVRWINGPLAVEDPDAPNEEETTGIFATLDRDGINRLIRVLRRARDAVYGRDE